LLSTKQTYAGRLEYLLHERLEKIDELTAQVDQLRQQNRRSDAEAKPSMTAEPAQAPSQA
jgi:septal ring factor EnvC (AmiA/AmiB activator)